VTLPRVLLLAAVVIWGWTFVATKVCLRYLETPELLAGRLLIALPVVFLLTRARGVRLGFGGHGRTLSIAAAIFFVHFVIQLAGLETTSATHTSWIIAVTPLALAVLARPLLGERIGRRTFVGIVVATVGILVLVTEGNPFDLRWGGAVGDWLILVSAHTWALYTIAIRNVARIRDPLAVTLAVLLPAALGAAAWVALRSGFGSLLALPLEGVVSLLFLGICGTALANWFWQFGVARLGAVRAGTFLYLEPIATTLLAIPVLGERPGLATLGGGLFVLVGVAVAQGSRRPRGRGTADRPDWSETGGAA
jgi:drug/metabolite transporter (DMT)-like permease